jgi:quinol monooxygenase YgiN
MKKISIIRYETKPKSAEENQRLVEQIYAELNAEDPGGIRYATVRLPDGVGFVHLLVSETDDDILGELPAFKEFAQGSGDRIVGSPNINHGTVIGSYRFPGL